MLLYFSIFDLGIISTNTDLEYLIDQSLIVAVCKVLTQHMVTTTALQGKSREFCDRFPDEPHIPNRFG